MDAPVVYRQIRLEPRHRPTGKTRHRYGCADGYRKEGPTPAALRIVRHAGDLGFYLDADGKGMTHTYHDSLGRAVSQAERELGANERAFLTSGEAR